MKYFCTTLTILIFSINSVGSVFAAAKTDEPQVTQVEEQEARTVAIQFTLQFLKTKDLAPIVKELYWNDFIERYKKFKTEDINANSTDLYLVSGLVYNSRLLTEGKSEDWQRFYVAANNFLLLGFLAGLKTYSNENANIKPSDLYPASVIELLNKNPNLANMIVRKGRPKAVSSVAEMRNTTITLEQAVVITRDKQGGMSPLKVDEKELVKVIKEDDFFKPQLEVADERVFGFPKGTRILYLKTPIGLQLMLARDGNKLKIFWTKIIAD